MSAETAIMRFCSAELQAASRRLAHRLKRVPITGVYGDDYSHRNLWAELCFEVHNGRTPLLNTTWDHTLLSFAKEITANLNWHTKVLLSYYLEDFPENDGAAAVDELSISLAICNIARELAGWERT